MAEAKRDEVPLPKAIAHLSIDPKPYPYLPRMLAHDNPVKGSKPVVLLDDVIAYGRQCVQAALESTAAELEALRGVSDEYNAWVYFHAAGGTFDEFIVKRCTQSDAALNQGGK